MNRIWIVISVLFGLVLLAAALLVPAHLRAVDAKVIEKAGERNASLIEEGLTLVSLEKIGPARLVLQAAQTENLRGADRLAADIARFSAEHPEVVAWGGPDPLLEKAGVSGVVPAARQPYLVVELVMQRAIREKLLEFLASSRRAGVQQILANRDLTNTVHFPPAATSSGQAFDGAVVIAGLLFQGDNFTGPLRDTIEFLAMRANKGDNPSSLELVYLDLLSLGRRMDWVSLTEFMKKVEDIAALRQLADTARTFEEQFPMLFASVQLTGQPRNIARYLSEFPGTGVSDLAFAVRSGVAGLELLLKEQQRIYHGGIRNRVIGYDPFGAWFYWLVPMASSGAAGAMLLKYLLLLLGCLFVARAVGVIGGRTQWYGLRLGADTVLALAIAFILALFSEPFIGLPSQVRDLPIRFNIPVVGSGFGLEVQKLIRPTMNQQSLVPLLVFFVIQALIYVWCLAKLNEIRRQPIGARMKLRLLENEDHLFDAGLYIGFVGTIIALIMFSLNIAQFSVMSAYGSTSFGIIFVSVLKIFHVRPLRRKLILESEIA